jgi:pyruvate dehydrogenase E2 component (dihydrolipoamide acetyltransferase)
MANTPAQLHRQDKRIKRMATEVIMPQMGESIFEGTITKWLKKIGDAVQKDEPLFEISTDKVDAEIPSPVAGVLTEIKVAEGTTVQINTVVASIGAAGEEAKAASAPAPKKESSAPAKKAAPEKGPSTAPVAKQTAGDGAADTADSSATAKAQPDAAGTPAPSVASSGGTEVVMPQMGESIFEGTITKWLKKVGDSVAKDEPLFEISTDKVDAEIPAPIAGKLSEIKVPEGATVQINTVVAVIGGSASGSSPASPAASTAPGVQAPAKAATSETVEASAGTTDKLRSSPLVRRIAKDNNLDLRQIAGTGAGGRITKDDALKFLAENGAGATAPAQAPAPVPTAISAAPSKPSISAAPVSAPAAPVTPAAPFPGELVPLTKMRSIIAQRMVESAHTSPHVHTVFKVDMTRIAKLREKEKGKYEQRNGVRLTYMPFIAAAAVQTLRKFPIVNASLEQTDAGLAIRYHQNINLGIAVSLDWGLIVPVIKQAEERSFLGLARAVADLAERARGKKLKPEEVSGSTFTLTNSGIFGEEFGTPIINQPDSAILAIGGLKKEPVVITDSEGNDTIAIRWTQNFCLGFDHRTIDGADAGRFMAEFEKTLEGWSGDIG